MREYRYTTPHGIQVTRTVSQVIYRRGLLHLLRELDQHRGIYLSSGYEYPGRYSRWDIASTCPPLEIVAWDRRVEFHPLNRRGEALVKMLHPVLEGHPHWEEFAYEGTGLRGRLKPFPSAFPEEERSKQPSVFSVLRALIQEFGGEKDSHLALVGAFGYDLLFQFEPIARTLPRSGHKDLHLFLCDDIWFSDRKREQIDHYQYDFEGNGESTRGLARDAAEVPPPPQPLPGPIVSDHLPEEYMANVEKVREGMGRGDYYEVVLRQTFSAPYAGKASELFERVQDASPSPYEFFLQFGDEQLVGASPEMFVRVEGSRVETCPISGTAQRTGDALRDAENIAALISSLKEESELTMCTDVDRNDKSRVCVPGTREGHGAPPHRKIRRRVPYRGPRRRHDPGRVRCARRLSEPHVGRDRDRRAQEGRRADHRIAREGRARLVRRRRRDDLAQRRHQHRNPHPHHVSEGRHRPVSGGRDAALRLRAGDGGARNAAQSHRLLPHPGPVRPGAGHRGGGPRSRGRRRETAAGG